MKVVVLAIDAAFAGTWPLDLLTIVGTPIKGELERWSVEKGEDWIAVSRADDVQHDHKEEELNRILKRIKNPAFYLVESNSEKLLSEYILSLPENVPIVVNNDHGWIDFLTVFRNVVLLDNKWLYRGGSKE